MILTQARAAFLTYLEFRRGSTPDTITTYRSILGQFIEFVGDREVDDLRLNHIDNFAEIYSRGGFKPKTYRNKLCVVKSFVKFLYSKKLTDIRPESIEVPPDRNPPTTYLDEDEKEALLRVAHCNIRDYAMLSLFLSSGMRVSEVANLKVADIFRRSISVKNGKGRKYRVTFMDQRTELALSRYRSLRNREDVYVFPNPFGEPLSRVIINRIIKQYAQKADINKEVKPHTLRHTFATLYLDAGGRIEDLQQMLGHTDLKTTMIYLHFTNKRLHSAYDAVM